MSDLDRASVQQAMEARAEAEGVTPLPPGPAPVLEEVADVELALERRFAVALQEYRRTIRFGGLGEDQARARLLELFDQAMQVPPDPALGHFHLTGNLYGVIFAVTGTVSEQDAGVPEKVRGMLEGMVRAMRTAVREFALNIHGPVSREAAEEAAARAQAAANRAAGATSPPGEEGLSSGNSTQERPHGGQDGA